MNSDQATRWTTTCVEALRTEYPYEAAHRSLAPDDCDVTPSSLHPAFHGSFDWHSSVHMQWSLVTLISDHPRVVPSEARVLLSERLTTAAIGIEGQYLYTRSGYERPYGWGWAAQLAAAALSSTDEAAPQWAPACRLLADVIADLTLSWLGNAPRAIRHGLHQNSGFCFTLLHDAFSALGRDDVTSRLRDVALAWFADDTDLATRFEPSGSDIFSPALSEAALMTRLLEPRVFTDWFEQFLPRFARGNDNLLTPPLIIDSSDGASTHWSGLALSRATQLCEIAATLRDDRTPVLLDAARRHREVAAPVISGSEFMSTHWLVSFAILADQAAELTQ